MPVATVSVPKSRAEDASLDLTSSISSLASSAGLSQAKAQYNQAARSFLHRRHVEAMLAAEKAFVSARTEGLQDSTLAERLMILRVTLLATIYRPGSSDVSDLFAQTKAGKMTAQDESAVSTIESMLRLSTTSFLTRVWVEILQFYVEVLPRIPSIQARAPSTALANITADPDTLPCALQPPAGVMAAVIMGALRVDDEDKSSGKFPKGKKEGSKARTDPEAGEGLQAARSMCEWTLNAHSKLAGTYSSLNAVELDHMYQQYSRVLQLYTLHILGTRLQQWDFAHQIARCAVEIREDEKELQDRQSLIEHLNSAQMHISTRGERRRIASEKARQRYEEEKAKRAASSQEEAQAKVKEGSTHEPIASQSPPIPRLRRNNSGTSNASSSASEVDSEGGIPSKRAIHKHRSQSPPDVAKAAPKPDFAEKREHISEHLDRQHKRAANGQTSADEKRMERRSGTGSAALLQDRLMAWMRTLSSNPSTLLRYLSAILAVLFIVRRTLTQRRPSAVGSRAETTRNRLEQRRRQEQSLLMVALCKVWDTLRMGTQVTYV